MRLVVCAALLAVLMLAVEAAGCGSPYLKVSVDSLARDPARHMDALVLTQGRYDPAGGRRLFVEGHVIGPTGTRVRVAGPVFDWIPTAGVVIEVWGRMRQDAAGPYLEFYNGRELGDEGRRPRVTPAAVGRPVVVVARLRQVGSEPFIHWILETEDRKTVQVLSFPPGFEPLAGIIVEARGVLEAPGLPGVLGGVRIRGVRVLPGPGPLPLGG